MKITIALLATLALAACATGSTPEQKIDQGYKTASATVRGTTVLMDRDLAPAKEGQRVHDLGVIAKQGLDDDSAKLAACRAKGTPEKPAVCDDANASISLYSGVLQQLETYLGAKGATK